jgi:hypothetical protein
MCSVPRALLRGRARARSLGRHLPPLHQPPDAIVDIGQGTLTAGARSIDHQGMQALSPSLDLEREDVQPYFIWDVPLTVGELRQHLRHPDARVRAQWIARVMREARYQDVWKLVALDEVLAVLPLVRRHLGRARRFWDFLFAGWERDGLLPQP